LFSVFHTWSTRNAYTISVEKLKEKRSLEKPEDVSSYESQRNRL
jgi:hypothetical protein